MERRSSTQKRRPFIRVHFLIIFIIFVFSLLAVLPAEQLQARPVGSQQAKKMVKGWLKLDPRPLREPLGNKIGTVDVFNGDDGHPVYYVINLQPSGFVIAPADDSVEPVIAFADDGVFDPSPDNPLGALVSDDLPGRIKAVRELQAASTQSQKKLTSRQAALQKACLKAQEKWNRFSAASDGKLKTAGLSSISDVRVAPLVQSKWGQTWTCSSSWDCYNYYTPSNYPSGCVATAMAQLMRYYQHPTAGIGSDPCTIWVNDIEQTVYTRGGDGYGGPYNWGQMVLDPEANCGSLTLAQRQAIGALCYDAGVALNMSYYSWGSGAFIHHISLVLPDPDKFDYGNAIHGFKNEDDLSGPGLNGMVNPNLDASYPVVLGILGYEGLHAVLGDGYGYNGSTLYHHLNMGWDGIDDAWYNLPIVDAYYEFDTVYQCIYNIYTSGTGEIISGRVTDGGGDPISGALVKAVKTGFECNDITDGNGIYALAKVPSSSSYTVSVTKTGYSFSNQNVSTGTSISDQPTSGNKWGINFVGTVSGPSPPIAQNSNVSAVQGVMKTINLQASDEGLPNPPGILTYVVVSLPSHGYLEDPCASAIGSVPYSLADYGNQVNYTASMCYTGSDGFDFKANDGGTEPNGGDSDVATITINVQSPPPPSPTVICEADFESGLPAGWTIIDGGTSSDTWTDTNPCGQSSSYWSGKFMIADSDCAGSEDMDEQLITFSIDCSFYEDVTLKYKHDFVYWSGDEVGDVDVRPDGGSWQNVARYQGDDIAGSVELDLSSIADGDPNVHVRWHYYNANYDYYWGVDDIEVIGTGMATETEPEQGDFEFDCDVDLCDLAVFASAWQSRPGDSNWNPDCDISDPNDSVIDELDLDVFTENWMLLY